MAVSLLVLGAVALVFAVFVQTKAADTAERAVPIDPNNAGPATVLAEASGVSISTPIRPASLTGLGYHPEGESLAAMEPRGKNLSANVVLGLLSRGETPERIHYYVMDAAGRGGPQTGAVALVFAVFVQTKASDTAERAVPIDPNNAGPATVLAETSGVSISTPIRPASLTGLGYHPEGESLAAMEPRGKNLSANVLLGLLSRGETPERIHYYVMDAAGRGGPLTGAVDVGATTGTTVYAPVAGTVTAIRPDPMVQNANVIEIKPDANPDVRLSVALVRSDGVAGVNDSVTAGKTELGTVADSAEVLDPQLSSYTADAGNHVTVSVSKSG